MPTSLAELQSANFWTTKQADELNTELMEKLRRRARYEPARLAIARSLAIPDLPPALEDTDDNESGKAIRAENLFGTGGVLATWVALIVEHAVLDEVTKKDVQDLVRRHWYRGIHLLWEDWTECGEDFDRFVMQLATRAGAREGGTSSSGMSKGGAASSGPAEPPPAGRTKRPVGP
jgi:DNA sulfur modification protein DndE